jgi:hypothetical protein
MCPGPQQVPMGPHGVPWTPARVVSGMWSWQVALVGPLLPLGPLTSALLKGEAGGSQCHEGTRVGYPLC